MHWLSGINGSPRAASGVARGHAGPGEAAPSARAGLMLIGIAAWCLEGLRVEHAGPVVTGQIQAEPFERPHPANGHREAARHPGGDPPIHQDLSAGHVPDHQQFRCPPPSRFLEAELHVADQGPAAAARAVVGDDQRPLARVLSQPLASFFVELDVEWRRLKSARRLAHADSIPYGIPNLVSSGQNSSRPRACARGVPLASRFRLRQNTGNRILWSPRRRAAWRRASLAASHLRRASQTKEIQPAPYGEIAVSPALGRRLRDVFGLERAPHRLGDLVELFGRTRLEIDEADLWAPAPTAHAVQTAGRSGYTNCAMDAIMLPAITGEPVELRSGCPHCGELVEVRVADGRVLSSHPAAVMSFGLLRDGAGPVQEIGCPVINLFASAEHYHAWVAATPQAETVMLPLAAGFAMASDLARGGDREPEPIEKLHGKRVG